MHNGMVGTHSGTARVHGSTVWTHGGTMHPHDNTLCMHGGMMHVHSNLYGVHVISSAEVALVHALSCVGWSRMSDYSTSNGVL